MNLTRWAILCLVIAGLMAAITVAHDMQAFR